MKVDLERALAELLDSAELDRCILPCEEDPPSSGAPFIKILFPRFREDSPDIDSLAEFLWLHAVNYVIPLRLRRRVREEMASSPSGGNLSSASRLLQRTRQTFINFNKKHPHRASEVGELLAYLIALRYLQAVQIASKMALKTNSNMPVHGLDGIHARFVNGVMTLYFLESKLAKTADSGIKEYAGSVKNFGNSRKQYLLEYEIISDLSNLSALSDDDRAQALEYLDVYGPKKSNRIERSIGIICYSDGQIYSEKLPKADDTAPDAHESAFASKLKNEYEKLRKSTVKVLTREGVDESACKIFFITLPNIDQLRAKFYEVMTNA